MKDRGDGSRTGTGEVRPPRGGRGPAPNAGGSTSSIWDQALRRQAENQRPERGEDRPAPRPAATRDDRDRPHDRPVGAAPGGRPPFPPSRGRDAKPSPPTPPPHAGEGSKNYERREDDARKKARDFGLFDTPAAAPPPKRAFWLPREESPRKPDEDRPVQRPAATRTDREESRPPERRDSRPPGPRESRPNADRRARPGTDIRPGGFAPRRRSNPRQVVDDEALVVQPMGPVPALESRPPVGLLKLALGEITEVSVEKLVAGGDGLGRHEGVPIFVPRSAPGDRLRVRLVERHGDYGRAEILEVLTPGPGRRLPPCPYFDRCGGCDLQHLEDGLQSKLKAAAVLETVVRMGKVEVPANLKVVTGASWGYRLRAQLHTARPETPDALPQVGYFARRSKELVAVDSCPILVPELEAMLPQLPSLLAESRGDLPHRLDLAAGDDGALSTAPVAGSLPHGPISLEVGGFHYAFDARTFFQGHRGLVDDLVAAALGPAEWTGELAVDLYAGVGLFSLPLATRYQRVLAVEGDRVAARYARTNVKSAKSRPGGPAGTIKVIDQAVESWITELPAGVDRVIADPPRTGLKGPVVRALLERRPKRVTYVSCHPATFARDLRALGQAYQLEALTLIDLFPQTGHMELVAQLALIPPVPSPEGENGES